MNYCRKSYSNNNNYIIYTYIRYINTKCTNIILIYLNITNNITLCLYSIYYMYCIWLVGMYNITIYIFAYSIPIILFNPFI